MVFDIRNLAEAWDAAIEKKASSKTAASPAKETTKTKPVDKPGAPPLVPSKPIAPAGSSLNFGQKAYATVASPVFQRLYAVGALVVLASTTVFWSILSARLHSLNADQIVDPYLFSNGATFHGASFPGAHSFLIKWPLFWLVNALGVSSASLVEVTVGVVLVTVAVLVFLLYRIERRPLVFGTLCLALASCLLLVPAQPAAGTLLPVNMAMLASRNLEYVLYLAGLVLLTGARKTRNWRFWAGAAVLGLLVASDKLFLAITVGGATLALLVYALRRNWRLVEPAARWLLAGVGATLVAYGLLALLHHNIAAGSGASPYPATHDAKGVVLGAFYAVLGFLTNFGVNPAFSASVVSQVPHQILKQLATFSGPGYVVNLLITLIGLWAAWQLLRVSLFARRKPWQEYGRAHVLSLLLIWSSLASVLFFVATDHYYAVDARYLTICLFALFIIGATYTRQRQMWRPDYLVLAGMVMLISIALAIPGTVHSYHSGQQALSTDDKRNHLIAEALSHHHVDVLVGDYWRVIPTKLASQGKLNVMPLSNCSQAQDILTSKVWQPDLRHHSFAYLLSYDSSQTNFPNCTLGQIVEAYGRPNASVIIAGNFSHPREVLLFYDHGSHSHLVDPTTIAPQPLASVIPISVDQLPGTSCDGPTVMNIVAHQDDDLLFMNPDLLHDIHEGHCVRTVYVTAGDAGAGQFYWLNRQEGSEDAYATMLNMPDTWVQRIVKLSDNSYVTIVSPRGYPKISLIFMNLPDGGLTGQGFGSSHYESLAKLASGHISDVQTVDHESNYTSSRLIAALATLMHTYQPAEIRTQAPVNASEVYPDHSDHLAVGQFTRQAYNKYEKDQYENEVVIPIKYYIGYPIRAHDVNVSGDDLAQKETAFLAYAKHDGGVCHSATDCANTPTYNAYLARQYQQSQ